MDKIERLSRLIDSIFSYEILRKENLKNLKYLYKALKIHEKVESFEELFEFTAINLSGVSLQKESFLQLQPKKYVQIIGIKKEGTKSKNINLRYFGKAEGVERNLLYDIVEFVIRWRLEKNYINLDGYISLLQEIEYEKEVERQIQ